MKIWDISLAVTPELPVWPGDPKIVLERYMAISKGDVSNVSRLDCGVHVGTHVDAPIHFIENGLSIEKLPLDVLIGPVLVIELSDVEVISPRHLETVKFPTDVTRLLFKTRNSTLWADSHLEFYHDYVALTNESAKWLVNKGFRLIGIDYLSVQKFHNSEPLTHRILLEAGVIIIEGLNLQGVSPGLYQLFCLPLKLVGSDGAPARVVLIEE